MQIKNAERNSLYFVILLSLLLSIICFMLVISQPSRAVNSGNQTQPVQLKLDFSTSEQEITQLQRTPTPKLRLIANGGNPTPTPTVCAPGSNDIDCDGTSNSSDSNSDGDSQNNSSDPDDDNDGTPDTTDSTPGGPGTNPSDWRDNGWCTGCPTNTPTPTPTCEAVFPVSSQNYDVTMPSTWLAPLNSIGQATGLQVSNPKFTYSRKLGQCCDGSTLKHNGKETHHGTLSVKLASASAGIPYLGITKHYDTTIFGTAVEFDIEAGATWNASVQLTGTGSYENNTCIPQECYGGSIGIVGSFGIEYGFLVKACVGGLCAGLGADLLGISVAGTGSVNYHCSTVDIKMGLKSIDVYVTLTYGLSTETIFLHHFGDYDFIDSTSQL